MSQNKQAGLYVHVPFCLSKCDYCGFYSETPGAHSVTDYLAHLAQEIGERPEPAAHLFKTVFIGGGNPTCIGLANLQRLVETVSRVLPDQSQITEWTFESNPETLSAEIADYLATLPQIRLSMGIQRLNDGELAVLGRRASMDAVYRALDIAFARLNNIGGDFILGVPGCQSLADDLHKLVTRYPLAHVSAYFLTLEENTPMQKAVSQGLLADPADIEADELYEVRDALVAAGFEHYEISNHARSGRRCQHNLNYWYQGDYIGFGPAAVSSSNGIRLANPPDLGRWLAGEPATVEQLSATDRRNEHLMLRLRLLQEGLDLADFEQRFGTQPADFYAHLNRQTESGNLWREGDRIRLSDCGLRLADEVMASLFI
ncbi:MAG: Oxygen-independent coproporphyrinogen-III oxidase-like protein YggW [Candidatus Rifleibacterium amylolyticum]|nr:MAG: Oxygen-independent coproporphyrinogen-III oxidase-like protein YggW [Candidatus Rifleibacterium amylolyticum]